MKQVDNIYIAEDGNFIVRKKDGSIMGKSIDLGTEDSIENYEEQPYTEESYKAFYESIGVSIEDKQTEEKTPDKRLRKGREK